jgi:hypothetical protein
MQLPLVAPAPLVAEHAGAFRDLFENRCQFEHFCHYLTGLMVLADKSLANIARCTLLSADKTNLARFFSEAPWPQVAINERRIEYLLKQTSASRCKEGESALVIDDTLCEHVGSLFEHVDRHYNHGDNTYPLAHNPVTSHFVSGAVRFPVDLGLYRRYEEITKWERFVHKHFPDSTIPRDKKERARFRKQVEETLLDDEEFAALHAQFKTKITLSIELVRQAVAHHVPFGVVLFDGWYLAEELVKELAAQNKDWVSLLKKSRNLETNSFVLKDAQGEPIALKGPHLSAEALVALVPGNAYREVKIGQKTYWCFTMTLRVPSLGKIRLVISYENASLTGTYALLVSNRLDWNAQRILSLYLQRWPIETFYQDGKGHLGLDEYRMRGTLTHHWLRRHQVFSVPEAQKPLKSIGVWCS